MKLEKYEGVEFMENIRYAVRVFAFRNNKLICIKYKKINKDYIDIPGGKIEPVKQKFKHVLENLKKKLEWMLMI